MHTLEPYWNWRDRYTAEEDERSPFHGTEHSEFEFTHAVYDHLIHPQWDSFGSSTLYMKLLYADYDEGWCILELIGEWNDLLHNDIMLFKREIAEHLMTQGIGRFLLIGENVLNFHAGDEEYYAEWWEELEAMEGWVAFINFREHVLREFASIDADQYFLSGGALDRMPWRTMEPEELYGAVSAQVRRRLPS